MTADEAYILLEQIQDYLDDGHTDEKKLAVLEKIEKLLEWVEEMP